MMTEILTLVALAAFIMSIVALVRTETSVKIAEIVPPKLIRSTVSASFPAMKKITWKPFGTDDVANFIFADFVTAYAAMKTENVYGRMTFDFSSSPGNPVLPQGDYTLGSLTGDPNSNKALIIGDGVTLTGVTSIYGMNIQLYNTKQPILRMAPNVLESLELMQSSISCVENTQPFIVVEDLSYGVLIAHNSTVYDSPINPLIKLKGKSHVFTIVAYIPTVVLRVNVSTSEADAPTMVRQFEFDDSF